MPYLLDGNNLVGAVRRTGRPSEADRSALIAEIAERLRHTRASAILFFDGPAGTRASSLGRLSVRVPSSGSADDAIVREVERAPAARETVVVTADRELARRVRDAGGRVLPPGEFLERFGKTRTASPSKGEAGPVDVEDWMRYFEDERNRE